MQHDAYLEETRRIYMALRSALSDFQRFMNPIFQRQGLKPMEGCLLAELHHRDGQSAGELAVRLSVAPANLVPLRRALEHAGMIECRADEHDGRSHRLYLTERGRATLSGIDEQIRTHADRFESEEHDAPMMLADAQHGFEALHALFAEHAET